MNKKDDILDEYLRLSKKANRRLYSLEKLSNEDYFKPVTDWAYRKAMKDIRSWGGNNRFPVNKKMLNNLATQTISAMRNDVYNFLNSKTSTKRDIIHNYVKKTDTFNKLYKTNWNWVDMANYFENDGLRDKLEQNNFASKTSLQLVGVFRKNPKEVEQIIKDYNKKHKIDKKMEEEIEKLKGNKIKENKDDGALIFDEKNIPKLAKLFKKNKLTIEDFL